MDGRTIERGDSVREFCRVEIVETGEIRQRNVITSIILDDGPIERGCPGNRESKDQSESRKKTQRITANGSAFAAKSRTEARQKPTADRHEWPRMEQTGDEPQMNADRRR